MNYLLLVVVFLMSALHGSSQEKGTRIHNGFGSGEAYLDMTEIQRRGYAMGFANGILLSPLLGAPKNRVEWLERCIEGMSDAQVEAILTQHIKSRPAEWHLELHTLSYRALIDACPYSPLRRDKK